MWSRIGAFSRLLSTHVNRNLERHPLEPLFAKQLKLTIRRTFEEPHGNVAASSDSRHV